MFHCETFIKSKEEVYMETISYFTPQHTESYISSIVDTIYEDGLIDEEVSAPGWAVFVGEILFRDILKKIHLDTERAKKRLILAKCLAPIDELCIDLQEEISSYL